MKKKVLCAWNLFVISSSYLIITVSTVGSIRSRFTVVNWLWVGGDPDSKLLKVINVHGHVYSAVSAIVYSTRGTVRLHYSRHNTFILQQVTKYTFTI